ncbi:MAG: nuclear transport factor 2 family protein [Thermoleophilaceae bacterium]
MLARSVALAYAAANRRDFEVVLVGIDAEIECRCGPDVMPPDVETALHGHDGYLRRWRCWLDAFEDIRWDPEEMLDLGDSFLVRARQGGRGCGSGAAVGKPVFQLYKLERGAVIRLDEFVDLSTALAALRPV